MINILKLFETSENLHFTCTNMSFIVWYVFCMKNKNKKGVVLNMFKKVCSIILVLYSKEHLNEYQNVYFLF